MFLGHIMRKGHTVSFGLNKEKEKNRVLLLHKDTETNRVLWSYREKREIGDPLDYWKDPW